MLSRRYEIKMRGAKSSSLLCNPTLEYYSKTLHYKPSRIPELILFATIYTFPSDLAPILEPLS